MSATSSTERGTKKQPIAGRSGAEWVTFGIALSIVLLVAGLVVYDWLTAPRTPPQLTIQQSGEIRAANSQYYVPFEVTNTGGNTAESVQIIAELEIGGEIVEEGEQNIDFLSAKERQSGEFIFTQDPAQGSLVLRVASYKEP